MNHKERSEMMELALVEDNGSTTVMMLQLTGPVPRVGELIHLPGEAIEDMGRYAMALVTDVTYHVQVGQLVPVVTAVASHGNPEDRHLALGQLGWLDVDPHLTEP